jgi:hypothetical protein
MPYTREEAEGRALAYVASILFSIGLAVFSGARYACRELGRRIRERRSANWPTAMARIATADVHTIYGRFIAYSVGLVGYSYQIEGSYYSGYFNRQFWDEQQAWGFVDSCQNKSVLIHYKLTNPQVSVLSQIELSAEATMDSRALRPSAPFGPKLALLWSLRNVSDWAQSVLRKQAKNWPLVSATVKYAEPRIIDDDAHWAGEMTYEYLVEGTSYSGTYYFRAYGEEEAREQVHPWRGRKLIVHYYPGNPARSVFIPEEQAQTTNPIAIVE